MLIVTCFFLFCLFLSPNQQTSTPSMEIEHKLHASSVLVLDNHGTQRTNNGGKLFRMQKSTSKLSNDSMTKQTHDFLYELLPLNGKAFLYLVFYVHYPKN